MGLYCCVKNCRRRSHDHRGRRIPNGLTFYSFPAWRATEGGPVSELTRRRRAAWLSAVDRSDFTVSSSIPSSMRVCSRHFLSGKPAHETLRSDPDWVPSLHLGHDKGNHRQPERLLLSGRADETRPAAEGLGKPAARALSAARSLLRSLRRVENSTNQQSEGKSRDQPAAKKTNPSFRDFFRDSLQASLEASVRSKRQSSTFREPRMELSFKPVEGEAETCNQSSSSCCQSCVKLKRRLQQLEERLSQLTRGEEVLPDQVPQRPQAVGKEEKVPGRDEDRPRPRFYFKKEWLDKFWFLRYSPELDHMWCHVCRLHAEKGHRKMPLIKGSRLFKKRSIVKHLNSIYHNKNVKLFLETSSTWTSSEATGKVCVSRLNAVLNPHKDSAEVA